MIIKLGYYHFNVPADVAKSIMNAHIDGQIQEISQDWTGKEYVYTITGVPAIEAVNGVIRTAEEAKTERDMKEFEKWKAEKANES